MRHKKSFNHLGRKSAHRKAMLSNMAASLITHKRIKTTTAKAKALKRYIEPIITRSKDDSTHSRRVAFSYLQDKDAVSELFREVGPKIGDRPGGYTRIIKLGSRLGDSAEMCFIELVDFNENLLAEKAAEKKSTRRRRGGKKKTTGAADVAVADQQDAAAEGESSLEEVEASVEETVEAPVEEVKEDAIAEEKTEEPVAEAEAEAAVEEKKEETLPEEDAKEPTAEAEPEAKAEENKDESDEKDEPKKDS